MSARDPLLDGLDETQRAAVTCGAAPLAILAGAGSGKTRVLTRRIAWQSRVGAIDANHVLAVTFTRKAAGELVTRLERLGVSGQVTAGTFHAIALAQLRRRAVEQGRSVPELLTRKVRLLAPMMPGRGRGARGAETALAAADVAAEIEWAKARLLRPGDYAAATAACERETPRPAGEIARLYERYEHEKRRRGLADFDDLIWRCADILEDDPDFCAVQRWRFRHLFVDEFQDANPAQVRLLRSWLGNRPDLCVVGDGDQAIYSFAGADPSYLRRFERHFPDATVVQLGSNYRSSPQVLAAARAVVASPTPIRSPRPDGPRPVVVAYPDDAAEATGVASGLQRAHGASRPWSSMAVLYRTNAQSAHFEEALADAGVPFWVRGEGGFLDRPEVQVALERLEDRARSAPGTGFAAHLEGLADSNEQTEERREHADALVRLGREYLAADGGPGSVDGFRAFLVAALRGDDSAGGDRRDAVQLLTFHRAKGLEWETVFVTGLEQGLVPISHARTSDERSEERRLLYVALTRAMRGLHLSWARRRVFGAREVERKPSPLLAPVEQALNSLTGAGDAGAAADPRERLARVRAEARAGTESRTKKRGPDLSPADAPLFSALVEWRRNLARASGVPAFVIFHDTTLAAVAAARPRSRQALLAVPGVGKVKATRHGDALLALVQDHA